ncbi:ribose 5-phosphate isomerase B (plasmid) [Rhizobium lusitanum]|uniref:ribose 5-phosphate isomerase B n=1 Tax=Rhizobium lusitanum TaxID=293958 RepID=UPI00161D38A6|nr:ribose 5-phosphate isomerase B [Rhizobium lusitanum]QND44609.1 ribose 5-phosphate isomerase B [Rhizobium lusitanum]
MPNSKIVAMGNDHVAHDLKFILKADLEEMGYKVINFGCDTADAVDYPNYAKAVANAIIGGEAAWGVLICGSGLGISIAANRFKEIRATPIHDALGARLAREHNNANVLCLGAQMTGVWVARDCLKTFLATDFLPQIHGFRVDMLTEL